jgi:hypothetical protein
MTPETTQEKGQPASLALARGSAMHLPNALPCPFCGGTRIVKGERYYAMCVDCGATGPERNADATAGKYTKDWNGRVPSSPNNRISPTSK